MKTNTFIVIAAAIGLSGIAHAEEGKRERPPRKLPPEIIAKFDKDGDGKLNEAEREAAKAARGEMEAARKAEMLAKFDSDGNGILSEDEKKAAQEAMQKMMLEKFDKDGDGKLSEDERAEMRKAAPGRPGGPRGPKGKGEGKGPRPGSPKGPGKDGVDAEAPGVHE